MARAPRDLHVILCGAGLGGLAAAIAIARAGAKVTVLEASAELGEIGAGIQVTPNVSRFLVKWGVDDIIGDDLVQCDDVNMRDADGTIIGYTDLSGKTKKDYGYPWWVVHRHHLHQGLSESARRHGVEIVIDARVAKVDDSATPVKVTTEKGATYSCDLLIGSDGLRSVVRQHLFPDVKPRAPIKNAAYRAIIPYADVFAQVPEAKERLGNNIDVWLLEGGYVIMYPISGGKDLNIVLSHHRDNYVEDVEAVSMQELYDFYDPLEPMMRKIIRMIPSSSRWPLLLTGPLPSWSNAAKTIVLMGDAAHSMQNHMAQGAATSIEDGAFLGRTLSEVIRGVITLPEAVAVYEKTRMPRAWIKQQISFYNGQTYHLGPADATARKRAAAVEVQSSMQNVTSRVPPPPTYRSWNLWGWPDSSVGVFAYDAEGDADNAVCEFLQSQGGVDPATKVAARMRDKFHSWHLHDPLKAKL